MKKFDVFVISTGVAGTKSALPTNVLMAAPVLCAGAYLKKYFGELLKQWSR